MASLGKIEEFNPSQTNIARYLERLEQYFEANDVPPDSKDSKKRRAILISVVGARTYDVLSDLCSPHSPSSKDYDQLSAVLKSHYAPKKLVIAERYRFHNCVQKEGETVSAFVVNLKRLAATCNFGAYLNEALRDRFVCGLRSSAMKKKLLTEDYTFANALKTALGIEAADKDVADISQLGPHSVNKVGGRSSRQQQQFRQQHLRQKQEPRGDRKKQDKPTFGDVRATVCASCGKQGHARASCKYRNFSCYSCGKAGHIAAACKGKAKHLYTIESKVECEGAPDPFSTAMYNLGTNKHGIEIPVKLEGIIIPMELDTGAGVSIISKATYDKHFKKIPLVPCSAQLHTYTGDPIKVEGQISTELDYNGRCTTLPLVVVEGSGPSLFGRDWLSRVKLDWNTIFNVGVSSSDLSQETRQKLHTTIHAHPNVFKPGLGTIRGIKAKLEMKEGVQPKFCRARPVPYALQQLVDKEYDRLEAEGIIEKVEFSEWATPMVHISKTDQTTRSCGDYAVTVNPQLNVPQYPIPLPEEVFHKLRGGKRFTKLDLKNAYQQLLIDEESQQYVTINTHRGLYCYKRLPFGIASSPAIFQRTMDIILQALDNVSCIQDDILVSGKDDTEHLQNLEVVLQRLEDYGVRLKLEKCKFMQKSVTYMGCVISAEGIQPTEEKVTAIKEAPRPENTTQLRSFLGLVNYHGKFIQNLSAILHPLHRLLQKGQEFKWSSECERAFQRAKDSLSSSMVLVHYNPELPLLLECDASPYGIGAVISHRFPDGEERPIAYASRSWNAAERNYSQIEKEGLSIVFGLSRFYMYLYGRKFILYTDHKPLLKIFAPDAATPVLAAARLQRWSLLLASYQYEIRYKSSAEIANADALSRLPLQYQKDASVEDSIYNVADHQVNRHPVSAKQIARETARDRILSKALSFAQHGWSHTCDGPELKPYFTRRHELSVEQGCLMWGLRVIIPPVFQQQVLSELHGAHPGVARMKVMARSHVWWPKMNDDIEETARSCQQCIKTRTAPPSAALHPWIWPTNPWQRIHIDFATYDGKHYLIMVDAHSKWPEVIGPMRTTTAEATIAALRSVFSRFGLPEQVVSDNGPPFQSAEYDEFLRQNGIQRVLVSPYHPSSNGQAERFVQTFKNFLKAADSQSNSLQGIQNFLLVYRSTPHCTTGCSPAKLFLQREVKTRLSRVKPDTARVVAANQSKMKTYHDQHAKLREFAPGQAVLARDHRSEQKWQSAVIQERKAPHSYTVTLPDGRTWNRHADHLLQDGANHTSQGEPIPGHLGSEPIPPPTPVIPPTQVTSPVSLPSASDNESSITTQDIPSQQSVPSVAEQQPLAPRRSKRVVRPPKRLIEEI